MPSTGELWAFLPWGYLLTISLELPVLLAGLSSPHPLRRRFFAGLWLTACTYPIVVLVLPILVWQPYGRIPYLIVAETFAPLAECLLFYFAFSRPEKLPRRDTVRDMLAITLANLFSFLTFQVVQWFLYSGRTG